MRYETTRYFFRFRKESDHMDCTTKEWDSLEKAIAYCHRYAKGIRFAAVEIRDENNNMVYEILADGTVTDYRTLEE